MSRPRPVRFAVCLVVGVLGLTTACIRSTPIAEASPKTTPETSTMKIESPAFKPGESIPTEYTCEGEDTSPALAWSNLPEGSKTLALIVDDPDAPDPKAPKRTWVHWVVYDIPASAEGLPRGGDPLPVGTREGRNDWGRTGYGGPCPPIGEHRYFFKLYALDVPLGELGKLTKAELEDAMVGHVLAQAELVGVYQKQG